MDNKGGSEKITQEGVCAENGEDTEKRAPALSSVQIYERKDRECRRAKREDDD